ncbi:MAG: hypothetical protein IJY26_02045, partial [Clostridia bacterium]|nr:hypothetical protein [Clostridia bacterium]
FQSDKCPGSITGNPLAGLNEKVCIQAEKVFDACIKQNQIENYTLTLTDSTPECPAYPLTFISARSSSSAGVITGLNIDRQHDKQCARVSGNAVIPLQVVYVDAAGVEGTATASINVPFDVLLFVPSTSIMTYNVTAIFSAVAPEGTFVPGGNTFSINACVTVILKVSMPVELLLPSYGYCAIPPAQEYSQEVCAGFFELPLYPQGKNCSKQ